MSKLRKIIFFGSVIFWFSLGFIYARISSPIDLAVDPQEVMALSEEESKP